MPRANTSSRFREITEQGRWRSYAELLVQNPRLTAAARERFETHWIEAGHRMRDQIGDDLLLVRLLRRALTPYDGDVELELFRGENRTRWDSRAVGLAWTRDIEKARSFARGLNATISGGVLLKVRCAPGAIISGPSAHSKYLDEFQFTLDPFSLNGIEPLEYFPPST